MNRRKYTVILLATCLIVITIFSVYASPMAFEHNRKTFTRNYSSSDIPPSYLEGDSESYNWNYSNSGDYSYNATELDVSGGSAKLLTNQSGPAWFPMANLKLLSNGFYEILSKRSQSARHFYNETSNSYRYQSDELVQYQDQWVTYDEYPIRYILRLRNSTVRKFETPSLLTNYLSLIDNSTIWGLGIESFNGVLGFYLNFQDVTNGHGQYIYYPRLRNGRLPAFNQPLYAIYPNLFVKVGSNWFNQLLNNRSLYSSGQNPRNNLNFQETSDTFEISFQTLGVQIRGYSWDITQGFKYNTTSRLYHLITEFRCLDRGFDDIGMAYEITTSPQSEGTSYEPNEFILRNETHQVKTTVQNAWNIGTYLDNFYSSLEIVSQNKESFTFSFEDMEKAGFSNKYLQLQDLELPNYETRKTLRAGMYGFGSYTQNQWINIDPTFSEKQQTDEQDFWVQLEKDLSFEFRDSDDEMRMGFYNWSTHLDRRGFISYDLNIDEPISLIENISMTFFISDIDQEGDEWLAVKLYYNSTLIQGSWNESYGATMPETVWNQDEYYHDPTFGNMSQGFIGLNVTTREPNTTALFTAWVNHHNSDPENRQFINMLWQNGTGQDWGEVDKVDVFESSASSVDERPTLTFDYLLLVDLPPEIDSPSDKILPYGFTDENITWTPTERTNGTDSYVVYRNGSIYDSGSWTNQTPIVISLDSINTTTGNHNFTIVINDTINLIASDLVWVEVLSALPPEIDSPSDKSLPYRFTDENITWTPTERDFPPDSYVVYRNGSVFDSGSWSNQTPIIINIDSINESSGIHNFTIIINDTTDLIASDLVYVTVASPIYYYYRTNPSITSLVNFSFTLRLNLFVVIQTTDVNTSIQFQLALNNQFKFWNGSDWEDITSDQNNTFYFENESNNESIIDTHINTFALSGNLSIKAFLHNSYNSTPLLDNVYVETENEVFIQTGLLHDLIANNSFSYLEYAFDYFTIDFYIDFDANNFTSNDNLSFYLLYVLPYTHESFLNGLVLYKYQFIDNSSEILDPDRLSMKTFDLETSEKRNYSLYHSYEFRDLIVLFEMNGNIVFDTFLSIEVVWYKEDLQLDPDFVEGILAFDDWWDVPLYLILFPLFFLTSGDSIIAIVGLTIGLVEIILFWKIITQFLRGR